MKFYQSIRKLWQQPKQNLGDIWQKRLVEWRKEASTVKVERPTRLDRARSLGYRAKEGIVIFRQKIPRGGKKKQVFGRRGRRPKRYGQKLVLNKSYQQVAEERVLNSLGFKEYVRAFSRVIVFERTRFASARFSEIIPTSADVSITRGSS